MTAFSWIPVLFVALITLATIGLGIYTTRLAKTASDFFVAGRSVSVFWNASAISGEYLSAASFMGIAGLLMKDGYDVIWYPVCYATGYLFLLLFIAGPLRRFGAYTIPDFAEGRFDSPIFRKIAVIFVLFIGFFYTMPQMKGAGITMNSILNWPYYAGILVVGCIITVNVVMGGMKSITFVQAFQYWIKAFAITVPVFILMSVYGGYNFFLGSAQQVTSIAPKIAKNTEIKFKGAGKRPANAINFSAAGRSAIYFPNGAVIDKVSLSRKSKMKIEDISEALLRVGPSGKSLQESLSSNSIDQAVPLKISAQSSGFVVPPHTILLSQPVPETVDNKTVRLDGKLVKNTAKIELKEPAVGILTANSYLPNTSSNTTWISPFGTLTSKYGNPLLYTYSLIIALVCGTAGLPHILVRFYTNPDGKSAKRTTLWVMVLIGVFYMFPPIWGAMGRFLLPALYANNSTDSVVIKLPTVLQNKLLGQILTGITSAGAFAAFMSTFSGLLVSMSGALAHDIYGKILRPHSSPHERLIAFKVAAIIFGAISMVLGCYVENFDITLMVGWAFAIAAASYFPLLLLGAWWRGLTMAGAASGMLLGGLITTGAIITTMLLTSNRITYTFSPIVRTLLEQPAICTVPIALITMFIVSKLTASTVPGDIDLKMLRLHAPEKMGLSKNYIEH